MMLRVSGVYAPPEKPKEPPGLGPVGDVPVVDVPRRRCGYCRGHGKVIRDGKERPCIRCDGVGHVPDYSTKRTHP